MNWRLTKRVRLANDRVSQADALRQTRTAREILRRFDNRPGIVLADEVGMGKTFVALAVAASVIDATQGERPVLVMVPPAVSQKWPKEWEVFSSRCLRGDTEIRATGESLRSGAEFLKLLDDPSARRSQLIFLTHGALTNTLGDPIIRMAIARKALLRPSLARHRNAFIRHATSILPRGRHFWQDQRLVRAVLETNPRKWRRVFDDHNCELDDDPVPAALIAAMREVKLDPLADALRGLPLRTGGRAEEHLRAVRLTLDAALGDVWKECMRKLRIELPLLILDEAHHTRNPNTRLAGLFAAPSDRAETEMLGGPLNGVFDRMLFLTATPFQLAHTELIEVLRRFGSVRWDSADDRRAYEAQIDELNACLDDAQAAALRLDESWSQLLPEDIPSGPGSEQWPTSLGPQDAIGQLSPRAARVTERYRELEQRNRRAERHMRRLVIRHSRGRREERRVAQLGQQVVPGNQRRGKGVGGLQVDGRSVLPFLLAARTQALIAARSRRTGEGTRAHFAEGIASSFEAYRNTRSESDGRDALEADATKLDISAEPSQDEWYLKEIDRVLSRRSHAVWKAHPKISATVDRAVELWEHGEKVLVFCFYISTGQALRRHISRAVADRTIALGATGLGLQPTRRDEVIQELRLIGERFMERDRPLSRYARGRVRRLLSAQGLKGEDLDRGTDVAVRFLRTPSFLVRFFKLSHLRARGDYKTAVSDALKKRNGAGISLADKVRAFGRLLSTREEGERGALLEALLDIPTGTIFGGRGDFANSEAARRVDERVPNVRLANGGVRRSTRELLMLTFNTPFFPDVLIASSVMAEGVDLHLNCRHVIHHDLDWNPSVLEQRTGRVDRLGSLAETSGKKIVVYEPYVEGTHDEKMFRVVKDRERWFNVMMGEPLELDEWSTELIAERPEFPSQAADALTIDLSLR